MIIHNTGETFIIRGGDRIGQMMLQEHQTDLFGIENDVLLGGITKFK